MDISAITHMNQILSITCDNASNNDEMIRHLEALIGEFKGQQGQTRCFAHILNLIAKSIIKQFDIPKAQVGKVSDEATNALRELAANIDDEEQETAETGDKGDNDEDENMDDWVDERKAMAVEQLATLDKSVQPARLMLVKVCWLYTRRNVTMSRLTMHLLSCVKLHSPSRIHLLFSFPAGMRSSKIRSLMSA